LRFEHLVSRDVAVKPLYQKISSGYHIEDAAISPAKVRIRGPEQRVNAMDSVSTDPIDLSGVVAEKGFRTQVNVGDPQVRMETPVTIAVKVRVALDRSMPKAGR